MTEALPRVLEALAQPFADPASRTFGPWLLLGAALALGWTAWRGPAGRGPGDLLRAGLGLDRWAHPSARADLWLLLARRLIASLGWLPELGGALFVATHLARWLDRAVGTPHLAPPPAPVLTLGYTLALFVAWDASRYALHRAMHGLGPLWALHQVHHSAEVLTPLTFHRLHPLEAALNAGRGALVGGTLAGLAWWLFRGAAEPLALLGVHGIGLVLNAVFGNLRHSHVWMRFGAAERWWISPAQHQLHHSPDPAHTHCNYGTWLAVWDRLGGSWVPAPARPPAAVGLAPADRNHDPTDLLSMLIHPPLAAIRALGRPAAAALLLLAGSARAQTPPAADGPAPAAEEADPGVDFEVIVQAPDGIPRVAGSAYTLDEEELERFHPTDIHQVVDGVPGVYIRVEDGFGLRPNIGMRGGNADRSARIALMEDGVPLAPAPYAAPAAYYFPMTARLVGVEVFKGPAAIRHGPQTIGGALNLRTRPVPTAGPDGALDVSIGQRKTASAHTWIGTGSERLGLLLEAAHLSSDGFKTLDTGGPTSFDRQDLMLKGRWGTPWSATSGQSVELKLGYGRERAYETYLGLSSEDFAADPYRRYAASDGDLLRWHRTQAELSWEARLGRRLELRTVAYAHDMARDWFKLNGLSGGADLHDLLQGSAGGQAAVLLAILRGEEDSSGPDQNLLRGSNDRRYLAMGLQSSARWRIAGRIGQELELGLRLHGDRVRRIHSEAPWAMVGGVMERLEPDRRTLDSRTRADALAVHVQDTVDLGRVEWVPGLRVEVVQTAAGTGRTGPSDPQTRAIGLPGSGVQVHTTDWLDLFAGVHRGFSPVPPGSAPTQRPETAWSYELGARAAPGESHLELVGFLSDYDRITGQCTFSSGCSEAQLDRQFDGGAAWIGGTESLVRHTVRLPGRVRLRPEASWTWTEARFRTAFVSDFPQFGSVQPGDRLPYVPAHQGALQLAVEHARASLALALTGRTALRDEAGQGEVPAEAAIPGAITADASGAVWLAERVELYATGTNLGNTAKVASWRPFGARPVAPRQLALGVRGRM